MKMYNINSVRQDCRECLEIRQHG